jgi:Tn3 transposase DDE domain
VLAQEDVDDLAHNAMARAVCFNGLDEICDRSFENQRHKTSGLNLIVAAITLWNTVYLERAASLLAKDHPLDPSLLKVNLAGDYTWRSNKRVAKGGFRPVRRCCCEKWCKRRWDDERAGYTSGVRGKG